MFAKSSIARLLGYANNMDIKDGQSADNWHIAIFFALGLLLRLIFFFLVPIGKAPDEIYHFERIYFTSIKLKYPEAIKSHRQDYPNHTYIYYPPLYYWLNSAILSNLIKVPLPSTMDAFHLYGSVIRLLSFLISTGTLILVAWLFYSLFPKIAILILAILYLFPQWTSSSYWINVDPLLILMMVITVIVATKVLTLPYKRHYPIIMGILAGVTMNVKYFAPMLWAGIAIGIMLAKKWHKARLSSLTLFSISLLSLSGWWFVNNYLHTGSLLATPLVKSLLSIYTQPYSFPYYTFAVMLWTQETFIASYGPTNNIRLPTPVYLLISLSFLIFLFALLRNKSMHQHIVGTFNQQLFLAIVGTMTFVALIQHGLINALISFQPQGRYLYPLFFLFPLLTAAGMHALVPVRFHRLLPWLVAIILLFLNAWGMHCIASRYWGRSVLANGVGCTYHRVNLPPWHDPLELKPGFRQ